MIVLQINYFILSYQSSTLGLLLDQETFNTFCNFIRSTFHVTKQYMRIDSESHLIETWCFTFLSLGGHDTIHQYMLLLSVVVVAATDQINARNIVCVNNPLISAMSKDVDWVIELYRSFLYCTLLTPMVCCMHQYTKTNS